MKRYFTIIFIFYSMYLSSQSFEKVDGPVNQNQRGSRASTFADINNDGWLDIFITNGPKDGENNELFINDGSGGFSENQSSEITKDMSPSDGATWGDVDNDGDLDLFVVTWYNADNHFYTSDENAAFVESQSITMKGYSETASWADLNLDGYLDLFVTNSSGTRNRLFINQLDGSFVSDNATELTKYARESRSVNWIDFDNDNDLDIFISNENAPNELYTNDDGVFTEIFITGVTNTSDRSTGSSWADYDNDGDLDLYVANFGTRNELLRNEGDGSFTSITEGDIVNDAKSSFGTAWGDLDNDGDLDLYVANAFDNNNLGNDLYINNGDGTFTKDENNLIAAPDGWTFGTALGDYDNDGFLDVLVANTLNDSQRNSLFHNLGNANNWLILNLQGSVSNRSAIGAKVKLTAQINGTSVTQMREVSSQSGYNGQSSMRVHFGLGDATEIEKVEIVWPLGNTEIVNNISVNQIFTIEEAIPEDFLRANFRVEAKKTFIDEPIEIVDLSVYHADALIDYAWDFDNDGTIDSQEKTPTISYQEAGVYTIKLMLTDATSKTSEMVRENYVEIEEMVVAAIDNVNKDFPIIYPNPITNEISIKTNQPVDLIKVLDGAGGVLNEYDSLNNMMDLTISIKKLNLKIGSYILMLQMTDGTIEYKKIVKTY